MTNVMVLAGRLTRDAELKKAGDYDLATFTIAFDVGFGQRKHTVFLECNWWGKGAVALAQYMTKGKYLTVNGSFDIEKWTGNDGQQRQKPVLNISDVSLGPSSSQNNTGCERPAPSEPPQTAFDADSDDIAF